MREKIDELTCQLVDNMMLVYINSEQPKFVEYGWRARIGNEIYGSHIDVSIEIDNEPAKALELVTRQMIASVIEAMKRAKE